jgi:hypothetical protein
MHFIKNKDIQFEIENKAAAIGGSGIANMTKWVGPQLTYTEHMSLICML